MIKLKSFKVMKRKLFMACAALVVSAAAVVGVKAYNYSQMSDLALANIEALSAGEENATDYCYNEIVAADGMSVVYCPLCPREIPGRAHIASIKRKC